MDKLLQVATRAGQALLMSGAETYRVEETVCKICEAYHVDEVSAFVLPTGMFVSVIKDNKTYSLNVRIKKRSTNLHLIASINDLARYIQNNPLELDELSKRIDDLINENKYSEGIVCLFGAISAFGFAFFFGGDAKDAICSFVIGFIVKYVVDWLDKLGVSSFIYNAIGGGIISLFAYTFVFLGLGTTMETIIVASIMLLVPGIAITNAIRDSLGGDLVSGIARAVEAALIATSIALGAACIVSLLRIVGGVL